MYHLIRRFLFAFDPEKVHYFAMNMLRLGCRIPLLNLLIKKTFTPRNKNPLTLFNLNFSNRIGLGAGFDKNARYLHVLDTIGFGFVEIGTVTPKAQEGNEKPRLFRLEKDKALINRMGFNNEGAEVIAKRLAGWRKNNINSKLIIGGNIGKNKSTPNEEAWKDYEISFNMLHDYVDYFVVNVSSPNTPGLRELQEKNSLLNIFTVLQDANRVKKLPKPILLKISPDLCQQEIDDIIELTTEIKIDGLIVSNTTINRGNLKTSTEKINSVGPGGLSGLPLQKRSCEMLEYIYKKTNGSIVLIGSGGIFGGADAIEKIKAGASLIQIWTGFIFEGPSIIKKISKFIS